MIKTSEQRMNLLYQLKTTSLIAENIISNGTGLKVSKAVKRFESSDGGYRCVM